jgi:hypothetical protein
MLRAFWGKFLFSIKLQAPYQFWRSNYLENIGWLNSFNSKRPVDVVGQPIPWYTYPAIEYIRQLDFSEKDVFEFGCGNSTLFWSKVARKIVSVEHQKEWHDIFIKKVKENVELKLSPDKESYIQSILNHGSFDVIIIDGIYRFQCAQVAISKLKPGGLVILDNSDWYVNVAQLLREANLIQVDMTGLGPINSYAWSTSFFFVEILTLNPKVLINQNMALTP